MLYLTPHAPHVQAYYGNLSAHACQRYGFLQAQERYKERASKNSLAGMVFRQVQIPPLVLHTHAYYGNLAGLASATTPSHGQHCHCNLPRLPVVSIIQPINQSINQSRICSANQSFHNKSKMFAKHCPHALPLVQGGASCTLVYDWLSTLYCNSSGVLQAMVLTDCRDQLDSYGIDTALKYLDNKLSENAIKRLMGENTMFAEVGQQSGCHPSHTS